MPIKALLQHLAEGSSFHYRRSLCTNQVTFIIGRSFQKAPQMSENSNYAVWTTINGEHGGTMVNTLVSQHEGSLCSVHHLATAFFFAWVL